MSTHNPTNTVIGYYSSPFDTAGQPFWRIPIPMQPQTVDWQFIPPTASSEFTWTYKLVENLVGFEAPGWFMEEVEKESKARGEAYMELFL